MATVDVTVMGAGIFGLSAAYACAVRGAQVRVIDPVGIGAGSSGGIVGALAPHTPENWNDKKEFQFQSLLMAQGFWAEVDGRSGLSSGYGRLGRMQSINDARALELAHGRVDSAAGLWRGKAVWRVVKAGSDWEPHSDSGYLIHDTLSARLHPRQACESLAEALRRMGVSIVIAKQVVPEGPEGPVLWATGVAGLEALSQGRARVAGNGVKGQAILLRHDAGAVPQLYAEGLHIIPHADGTVAIGSTSERDFAAATTTDAQLDDIHRRAIALCPCLQGAPVLARWAGVRPRARSRAPMLGAWPGREGHFIANGGFKIGFGMAPKVAEVMADLLLEDRDRIPEAFRVEASL